MRAATVRAARRRGWVCAIMPRTPRPAARQALGNWVVLPDPVSPATMTTGCARMHSTISSMWAEIGNSGGYVSAGRRSARRAIAVASAGRGRCLPLRAGRSGFMHKAGKVGDRRPRGSGTGDHQGRPYLERWFMPSSRPRIVSGNMRPSTSSWVIPTEVEYSQVSCGVGLIHTVLS